jgi:predicted  nucleic acid-binding Zn-ribbon protein
MTVQILNILKKLTTLQQKDTLISALENKLAGFPKEIENLQIKFEEIKTAGEKEKEDYKKAAVKHKEMENQLQSKEAEIAKHQRELNMVKSNDAFKALQKEIDQCKKEADDIETQILNQLELLEKLKNSRENADSKIKQKEDELKNRITEIENQKTKTQNDLNQMRSERKQIESEIEPEILKKYEYIKKQRPAPAVAAVKTHNDGQIACSGCNMLLNSQTSTELAKKTNLVHCDNCQRIIYDKEDIK